MHSLQVRPCTCSVHGKSADSMAEYICLFFMLLVFQNLKKKNNNNNNNNKKKKKRKNQQPKTVITAKLKMLHESPL